MSEQIESELKIAYEYLENFEPFEAKNILSQSLVKDLSNPEIMFCLKTTTFWISRKTLFSQTEDIFEQGEFLLSSWKEFVKIIGEEARLHEECIYSIRKGCFSTALNCYQQLLKQNISAPKALIFSRMGSCYKQLGDFETSLKFLSEANSLSSDDAQTIAEIADCYALCGQEKMSKVMFREALFINAQVIDTDLLESELFLRLKHQVETKYKDPVVAREWLPVEGVLLGVLNIKRELRAIEVGKLKQSIFALRNELNNAGNQKEILIPRLINKYFWLTDHYIATHEDKSKVNENLLEIKLLDRDIFDRYTV